MSEDPFDLDNFEFIEGVGNVHKNLKGKFKWFDMWVEQRKKEVEKE